MSSIDVDADKIKAYLKQKLMTFGTLVSCNKFNAGQSNPTYHLTLQDGDKIRELVLRKAPAGKLLPGAHRVDREAQIMDSILWVCIYTLSFCVSILVPLCLYVSLGLLLLLYH